jgi:hypothetical protein
MTHNDVVELMFEGWCAHKRGEAFNPNKTHHWRTGWMMRQNRHPR